MRLAVLSLSAVLLSGCSWLGVGGKQSGYAGGANCAPGVYGNQGGQYAWQNPNCVGGGYGVANNAYGVQGYGTQGYGAYGAYGNGSGLRGGYGAGVQGYGTAMQGYGAGVVGTQGYGAGVAGSGYGAGAQGYGAGVTTGTTGVAGYGAGAQGYGAYGSGTVIDGATGQVLGSNAPYGSAVGGQIAGGQYAGGQVVGAQTTGGQWVNGQWVTGTQYATNTYGTQFGTQYGTTGTVTTVQGAPIYVQQPYPAYYPVGVAVGGLRGGFAALPFGIEAGVGSDFNIGGDIVGAKPENWADMDPTTGLYISSTPAIAYKDAFNNPVGYDLAATYDVNPSTTLIGRIGYSKAEGQRSKVGTIDNRTLATDPTTATITEDLYAEWSDLEQVTLEGGVRKYMGGWNSPTRGIRPYVQATAGFTHNQAVTLSQDSATLMPAGSNVQEFVDAGWTPTASGAIGAEMQVGPRAALGVEAGVRWRDDLDTNFKSDDRWEIPVRLRGRVSF